MGNKKAVARERVKAMREEQARKERRKEQLMRFGIVGAVILAVGIIAFAVQASRSSDDGPVVMPAGVTEESGGVPLTAEDPELPTVEVWVDFSCPHCASFEATHGPMLEELADSGEANVIHRPVTFVGGSNSTRATNAWACSLEEDLGREFMAATFAVGSGYTNQSMLDIGESVGLDGGDFRSCVTSGTYNAWVSASHGYGVNEAEVTGTPTVLLNGEQIDALNMATEDLRGAILAGGDAGADNANDDADADESDNE